MKFKTLLRQEVLFCLFNDTKFVQGYKICIECEWLNFVKKKSNILYIYDILIIFLLKLLSASVTLIMKDF